MTQPVGSMRTSAPLQPEESQTKAPKFLPVSEQKGPQMKKNERFLEKIKQGVKNAFNKNTNGAPISSPKKSAQTSSFSLNTSSPYPFDPPPLQETISQITAIPESGETGEEEEAHVS